VEETEKKLRMKEPPIKSAYIESVLNGELSGELKEEKFVELKRSFLKKGSRASSPLKIPVKISETKNSPDKRDSL